MELIEQLHQELSPYCSVFQEAGTDGLRKVSLLPYAGRQWKHRRMQREAFLDGLYAVLPDRLGSFERLDELYPRNRLVYVSLELGAELIFRRRGSTTAYAGAKQLLADQTRRVGTTPPLFELPAGYGLRIPLVDNRTIACLWDLPPINDQHEQTDLTPFRIQLAQPGTALDENKWEAGFPLLEDVPMPTTSTFDPDELDWAVDSEEGTEGL